MNLIEPIVLGIVLSADSFSAAIAMGLRPHKWSDSLKFASASGGAELITTYIGVMTGGKIISEFGTVANWIAFLLLIAVAIHMLYEGFKEWKNRTDGIQLIKFHSFIKLLIVAIATSIDALAVGVSLGISNKPIIPYLVSIGGFAFASTIIGMAIAKKTPQHLSIVFNIVAALILIILGIATVI